VSENVEQNAPSGNLAVLYDRRASDDRVMAIIRVVEPVRGKAKSAATRSMIFD
jgi:hypothetical protein